MPTDQANQWIVIAAATGETDTVINVEVFQFDDTTISPGALV